MLDAETGERGFVITGDTAYLEPYQGAAVDVRRHLAELRERTGDNPLQQRQLAALGQLIDHRLATLEHHLATRRGAGFDSTRAAIIRAGGGKAIMDSVRQAVTAIEAEERQQLAVRTRALARREQAILLVVAIGTTLAAVLAALISGTLSRYASTQTQLNRTLMDQADELEEQAVELEMMNEALEERTVGAEKANQTKARFVATLSHDLRTPLNAIIGYADLMQLGIHGPLTDAQIEDLRRINRSSTHLLALLNEVLSYAKIEAGQLSVRLEDVDMRDVMAGVEAMVAPQASAKRLHFGYDDCDQLCVRADSEKLDQILTNLVTNAIKFTQPGGRVHIHFTADEAAVHLAVRDTGPGIPSDRLESVFEPFVQLEGGSVPEGKHGVGLGLAISREFARSMQGELTVQSALGEGSTFTLRLPRAVGKPAEAIAT
jgi:signal transduction histidine kinase